jgi:hypothetical protein
MKKSSPLVLLVLLFQAACWSGCAGSRRPTARPALAAPTANQTIVTPDNSLEAKVLSVNVIGRFVVLSFPEGRLPKMDQHLFLYRNGLRTAEVKVVGPQEDVNLVADLVSGEAQAGDIVRDQ